MSVAWFSRLYRLNEEGRFDAVVTASKKYLAARPKDYALHLQRAKALLCLGRLGEASEHLDAAMKGSKGLAAWPWFYRAALHARSGEREAMYGAIATALRLDPKLVADFEKSPFFAAHWVSGPFRALLVSRSGRPGSATPTDRVPSSPRATKSRRAPAAHGRTRAGASVRRRGGA